MEGDATARSKGILDIWLIKMVSGTVWMKDGDMEKSSN
jgi:hypothetical protein